MPSGFWIWVGLTCPPVQVIQRPQRRGKRIARSRNADEVVIGFGEPVAQASRGHRSEIIFVEPRIGGVGGARRLSPDRGAFYPFGGQHVADRLLSGCLPR